MDNPNYPLNKGLEKNKDFFLYFFNINLMHECFYSHLFIKIQLFLFEYIFLDLAKETSPIFHLDDAFHHNVHYYKLKIKFFKDVYINIFHGNSVLKH